MPRTRSQTERLNAILVIPPKHDVSLFQRRGNCIEGLPTQIFQVIKPFLSDKAYRDLMNTNLFTFQPIKFETAEYTFKLNEENPEKEVFIRHILRSVKDKSKQISLVMTRVKHDFVLKYADLLDGIQHLYIKGHSSQNAFRKNFPFEIFSRINSLHLSNILGISALSTAFAHTTQLELFSCDFETIGSFSSMPKLNSLRVSYCHKLVAIPPLDRITKITVLCNNNLTQMEFPSKSNCKTFIFSGKDKSIGILSLQSFTNLSLSSQSLHFLCLECRFPKEFTNFDFCQKISIVKLHNYSADRTSLPSFPVFLGKRIYLFYFSLFSWNCQLLPNVKDMELNDCINIISLPEMPRIQELELHNIAFETMPSFPSLIKLKLKSCSNVPRISFCPKLIEAHFDFCLFNLKDLTNCSHITSLTVSTCFDITDVKSFGKISDLSLSSCVNVQSLDGIQGREDNFSEDRRTIRLSSLDKLSSFKFCQYIYQLELHGINHITSCAGISYIHHLKFYSCRELVSSAGMSNITGSITFESCTNLRMIENLQNIPKVYLKKCWSLWDFDGLGYHESLHVTEISTFRRMYSEFVHENLHKELFASIKHLYLEYKELSPEVFCCW
jgi:hypothetical protein